MKLSLERKHGLMILSCALFFSLAIAMPISPSHDQEILAPIQVELVEDNLPNPVAMAFDPSGRLFFTDKSGSVWLIVNNQLQPEPVITLPTDDCFERGMLGIALDPDFAINHYIYVFHTLDSGIPCGDTENRIVRFVEVNGVGMNPIVILSFPAIGAGNHNGGNIHFGPDRKLYVSLGDDANAANSQNLATVNGKIHRFNSDGTIPTDNPFYGQPNVAWSIFAYGLRNSFDFDFDPITGDIIASENGPNCDDEVNRVLPGYSYGWRSNYPCGDDDPTYNDIPPLWRWTPTIAPTGVTFYRGIFPRLRNKCFMCDWNTGTLHYLALSQDRTEILNDVHVRVPGNIQCNNDIETGPDGNLYFIQGGGYTTGSIYRFLLQ